MTPRERWIATLQGKPVDRVATDYWATAEFSEKLQTALGLTGDALYRHLGIDAPRAIGASRRPDVPPPPENTSIWGVAYRPVTYDTGAYAEVATHPLAEATCVADVEAFPWPSPDDLCVDPALARLDADDGTRIVRGGGYEPFLLYCAMRGMEQAYVDLALEPEIVEAALERIFAYHEAVNRRLLEACGGRVDLFYLAEDLGGQHGPLFSLETYRRVLMPGQVKMAALARSYGARIFYHTDGAARVFLPDLIEQVGIDVLNPLQWRCPGMELEALVRDFGRELAFHGGIDNQHTLAFGTPEEVRAQVRWCGEIMRRHKARWICAPCHNIQAVSPVENVTAMYDEAAKLPVH